MELVPFEAAPATEPLYTMNPFAEKGLGALFDSHPPLGERVKRLRELDPDWRERLRGCVTKKVSDTSGVRHPGRIMGGVLLSRGLAPRVPSALAGLTSLFGMGRGVSPPL